MKKVEMVEKDKLTTQKNRKCRSKTPRSKNRRRIGIHQAPEKKKTERINTKAFGGQASVEEPGSRQREMKGDGCPVCSGRSDYPPSEESAGQRRRFERGSTWNAA